MSFPIGSKVKVLENSCSVWTNQTGEVKSEPDHAGLIRIKFNERYYAFFYPNELKPVREELKTGSSLSIKIETKMTYYTNDRGRMWRFCEGGFIQYKSSRIDIEWHKSWIKTLEELIQIHKEFNLSLHICDSERNIIKRVT